MLSWGNSLSASRTFNSLSSVVGSIWRRNAALGRECRVSPLTHRLAYVINFVCDCRCIAPFPSASLARMPGRALEAAHWLALRGSIGILLYRGGAGPCWNLREYHQPIVDKIIDNGMSAHILHHRRIISIHIASPAYLSPKSAHLIFSAAGK